jgi:hypothetical protein
MELLRKGNLHAAAVVYPVSDFRQSPYYNWDMDHITDQMNDDELVVMIKSAIIFGGRTPKFFVQENALSERYLNAVSEDNKIFSVDLEKSQAFIGKTYYLLHKITSLVEFRFYDFSTNKGIHLNDEQVHTAMDTLKAPGQAETMLASAALAENISFGSHGVRSYNFYYPTNDGRDTLALSYKLVTIKKEERYSNFAWRMLGVWDKVGKRAREEIIKGTLLTVRRVAKLPLDIPKAKNKKAKK